MDDATADEIEYVKQSDSQKSVATTNLYSLDFMDTSSGMETYVLEWDSEGSESPHNKSIAISREKQPKSINVNRDVQCDVAKRYCAECSTSFNSCSIFSQEIFTQTSKTIIELAHTDETHIDKNNLQTQTSFISIKSNKTVEYQIQQVTGNNSPKAKIISECGDLYQKNACDRVINNSLEDGSSKLQHSESESKSNNTASVPGSENLVNPANDVTEDNVYCEEQIEYDTNSDFEHTDFDDDSLMESEKPVRSESSNNSEEVLHTPSSVDRDVAELYNKLYERIDFQSNRSFEQEKKRFDLLTPLTEESAIRKNSTLDPTSTNCSSLIDEDVLFTNNSGIKFKLFPNENSRDNESFKLPPIRANYSCPTSPKCANANFMFSINPNKLQLSSGTLPCVFEERRDEKGIDRWEMASRDLASGESQSVNERIDYDRGGPGTVQLPPIHFEVGYLANTTNSSRGEHKNTDVPRSDSFTDLQSPINITDKIKELKLSNKNKNQSQTKYIIHNSEGRSGSPSLTCDENKLLESGERGCDLLCQDLLRRLRSASWYEVVETLDDIPKSLEKFWGVIAEHRIADLLRQVISQVESPRTQVSRTACNTLAAILKNTNYTKKPEFYEAVTILLIKTGSFSRPVRRAANVALDDIVCGVDLSHVVTALCIHGVTHKSPLVRCASARLLVVCCALGGGGRDLLRTRPPTAAAARKHALRSLAALLDDKNTDTRKYAERLYTMLRPLTNFEAFYLTDVDVELASRQMKKYDNVLQCNPPESR